MGLMDVLNGMRNGPRGYVPPSSTGGGMSPLTMGLLALLAYKAFKGSGGIFGSSTPSPPASMPGGPTRSADGSGDWLGGLGKLIQGGAGSSILTGGLGELVRR